MVLCAFPPIIGYLKLNLFMPRLFICNLLLCRAKVKITGSTEAGLINTQPHIIAESTCSVLYSHGYPFGVFQDSKNAALFTSGFPNLLQLHYFMVIAQIVFHVPLSA